MSCFEETPGNIWIDQSEPEFSKSSALYKGSGSDTFLKINDTIRFPENKWLWTPQAFTNKSSIIKLMARQSLKAKVFKLGGTLERPRVLMTLPNLYLFWGSQYFITLWLRTIWILLDCRRSREGKGSPSFTSCLYERAPDVGTSRIKYIKGRVREKDWFKHSFFTKSFMNIKYLYDSWS